MDHGKNMGDKINAEIDDAYGEGTRDGMGWMVEGVLKEAFTYLNDFELSSLDSDVRKFLDREYVRRDEARRKKIL